MGFHEDLKAKGKGAKDWINTFTEVEYLGGNKFSASITTGNRVFKDKDDNKWKKHKLTDDRPTKDYVLIQSAKCCVEIYPYYAKYFDVNHEEVRLHEERWVVQRLFKEPDDWRDVDAYNPVMTVEEYSEPAGDVVKVTITYDSDYGVLTAEYFQRDGNALKHNVTFKNTSGSAETFRVLQRWAGIAGNKIKVDGKKCETDEKLVGHVVTFGDNFNPSKIIENVTGMTEEGFKDVLEMVNKNREPATEEKALIDKNGLKLLIQGLYTRLLVDGKLTMGANEATFSTMVRAVEECPKDARVFIGGLGLGVVLFPLAQSYKSKEVIVCEKDERIINAVAPLILGYFEKYYPSFNLKIVQGDAGVEVGNYGKFDWIFMDMLYGDERDDYSPSELRGICTPHLAEGGRYTSWGDPEVQGYRRILYVKPSKANVHAQGLRTDFIYGNWVLPQGKSLTIDPDTATLDNPTEDGHVYFQDPNYTRQTALDNIRVGRELPMVVILLFRGYVEWDVTSIPDGSTITDTVFKYEGKENNIDCHIHEMVGTQPSAQADDNAGNQAIWDEAGEGTIYAEPVGFPVVAANQSVDLGASADSDLQNQLAPNWFAIGIQADAEDASYSDIYSEDKTDAPTPKPTLYVEYTLPANPLIGKPLISPDIIKKTIIR